MPSLYFDAFATALMPPLCCCYFLLTSPFAALMSRAAGIAALRQRFASHMLFSPMPLLTRCHYCFYFRCRRLPLYFAIAYVARHAAIVYSALRC